MPIASLLVGGELCLAVRHRLEQPHLVDEGQQDDRLPCELLAVEVDGEVGRVEVCDLRAAVGHELGQALGQRVGRARGQHAHELLEGKEGRALLELGRRLRVHGVGDVGGEGRVVVRVEPGPRGAAVVVVAHHPAEPLHVGRRHADLPLVVHPRELVLEVALLPAGHLELGLGLGLGLGLWLGLGLGLGPGLGPGLSTPSMMLSFSSGIVLRSLSTSPSCRLKRSAGGSLAPSPSCSKYMVSE